MIAAWRSLRGKCSLVPLSARLPASPTSPVLRLPTVRPASALPATTTRSLNSLASPPKSTTLTALLYPSRGDLCTYHKARLPLVFTRLCSTRRNMFGGARDAPEMAAGGPASNHGRELLPANVKPLHYTLRLEPNFEKFTYEGSVVIEYIADPFTKPPPAIKTWLTSLRGDQSGCGRGHHVDCSEYA
jgi:hypothetical protein